MSSNKTTKLSKKEIREDDDDRENRELREQYEMHRKVRARLSAQLDRMTKAMRKCAAGLGMCDGNNGNSSSFDDFKDSINAEHYSDACRDSFVYYYTAKLTIVKCLDRKRWEKYAFACDYLSTKMEEARVWKAQCTSEKMNEASEQKDINEAYKIHKKYSTV